MKIKNIHEMYDWQTSLIMRLVLDQNSCCVDVGAHRGEILSEIIDIAPMGNHFAFEPIPYLCELLKKIPFKKSFGI